MDDTFAFGNAKFIADEGRASKAFLVKPMKFLSDAPIKFNSLVLRLEPTKTITTTQSSKIERIFSPLTAKNSASIRATAQYVGVNFIPDVCATIQLLAPGSEEDTDSEKKQLSKCIMFLKGTKDVGLRFAPLHLTSVLMFLFSDAAFANSQSYKSHLGFVIALVDYRGVGNIVHLGSSRCKRVVGSVLAAELHGLTYGFDRAYLLNNLTSKTLSRRIPLEAYVDSKTLFYLVAKVASTTEKRLQIDVFGIRQSY